MNGRTAATMALGTLALLSSLHAQQPSKHLHAFYYPWYGNPATDGSYVHWNHAVAVRQGEPRSFSGGDDIGANFFPALGCYSSNRAEDVAAHMRQLQRARIGVVSVSWWGPGSFTDKALALLFRLAAEHQIAVAFHLEPHIGPGGRNAESTRAAIVGLLDRFGAHPALYRDPELGNRPLVYVYDSYLTPASEWATVLSPQGSHTLRGTRYDTVVLGLWVKEGDGPALVNAGFDGFYTYFATEGFTFGSTPGNWPRLARFAAEEGKLFVPCVGPGYVDTRIRPWNGRNTRERRAGAYYDAMFEAALAVKPRVIAITSFNEWHEGTQIEPATAKVVGSYRYLDYSPRAPEYYLDRTAHWVRLWETSVAGREPSEVPGGKKR